MKSSILSNQKQQQTIRDRVCGTPMRKKRKSGLEQRLQNCVTPSPAPKKQKLLRASNIKHTTKLKDSDWEKKTLSKLLQHCKPVVGGSRHCVNQLFRRSMKIDSKKCQFLVDLDLKLKTISRQT